MPVIVISKEEQGKGAFNGGEILENKPLGFPQDNGLLKPYSNLFYWAHAWTGNQASTIGEHPHKGFEIMSFVLTGSIEHYDSKQREWLPLKAGDAQIIRSGSGISHAERIEANSSIFQIWVDPGLENTLSIPASYNDYRSDDFQVTENKGMKKKIYSGEDGTIEMLTEKMSIYELSLEPGQHEIEIDEDQTWSAFMLEGKAQSMDKIFEKKEFVVIENEERIHLHVFEPSRLFVIESPREPSYKTYRELVSFG